MPSLSWAVFDLLPGSRAQNFENLCRGLMRLHFAKFGKMKALANQPGVEFHIKLREACPLGDPPRWFGWQCKCHTLTKNGDLSSASKKDIELSLRTTEGLLPDLTDWILWTPYTLSRKDQNWFYAISTQMNLQLWSEEELDTYLCGDGLLLRGTYFGDLILTPSNLEERHRIAIQPIRDRWMQSIHQSVDAERMIRRMLGEPGSWSQLGAVGNDLAKAVDVISPSLGGIPLQLELMCKSFVGACAAFADTLLRFHEILAQGDLDIIQQKLKERKTLIDADVRSLPRKLRTFNLPIALDATNALDDMRIAQDLLDEVEELLGVGLVALLADAGGGKTQMAAQLSAPQTERPAGIFLQGRNLHRGQTLDDLSRHFVINGNPLTSMESLVASLDAAGKRAKCRLPILIDGLNEAENPMDWKPALASLGEIVKKYPNVLILTTLRTGERRRDEHALRHESQTNDRESFAVMALPEGMRKIECEGFGGDVDEAIDKYFSYFKINPGDAEIPVDLLQHPLTLRIFCEVTNPERKNEIKINHFPSSISALFEKYIANACQRISEMPNLSQRYSAADVDVAIYKFGCLLWESRQREVGETFFREEVSDTSRHWDSSIVNLLAQEGVIFKNPGTELGTYVVTPTYDALGGYIISNSLLRKYAKDTAFDWLTYPETTANFFGDDSHELAFDVFISLVALTPRRISGKQIWKDAPPSFRKIALSYTTTIEPEYIDRDTVAALLSLIRDSQKQRIQLFPRLMEIRGVASHPLNSEFLDSALRSMTVSDRDLSWTEWVRGTRTERINDLLSMEMKWKENFDIRTASDRLRAKWVMWLLTSTDRELRDIATRALYWFGRGAPGDLFKECLVALEINDPYVPERMLAASYGVAMAKCIDIHDQIFVGTTLSDYARGLYNAMFADDAPFSTTHALIREYGQRIIEISSLNNPSLFSSEELKRSAPPFLGGGIREWGVSDILREREKNGFDSPFRMDFENYTIGSLVPGRSNYDYGHEGYRSVRAQILWRIEQLGWSSELFKDLDKLIANEQHWPRSGGDAKKSDRYGKKYSWIAFFEMSGLLHDQGAVENWRERTSTVDIDPSFPERVTKGRIILADFLGDSDIETKEWIARGSLPDVSQYLRIVELQKEKGPWIALDGFFTQQDETRGRKIFCFIRSFLISTSDVSFFVENLSKQDLGGRWLPEKPEVFYTFAGEIPWCETFPGNDLSEFSFVVKEEPVKVLKNQQVLYLDGKKWGGNKVDLLRRRLLGKNIDVDQKKITDEDIARIELREESVEVEELRQEYVEFKALIPVSSFGWEGYQSTSSDAGHATTLAKEIVLDLGLIGQPQTFDLFTKAGIKATYGVSDQSGDFNNNQSLFFIRESLLQDYLQKNNMALVWAIWGEREYASGYVEKFFHGTDRPEQPYVVFSSVRQYE